MKSLINTVGFTSLLTLSSLLTIDSAFAFSVTFNNAGFENQYDGWTTTGDATVQPIFQNINPTAGSSQALITNACHYCVDGDSLRNDDSGTKVSTFNYSNTNPVSSTVSVPSLQTALQLDADALNILVEDGTTSYRDFYRTPKEGSGILSDTFTVTDGDFTLSFNWNYLTNDGANGDLGDQDFSFVTIYSVDGTGSPINYYANSDTYTQIDVLSDSTGGIPTNTTNTTFDTVSGYNTYTSGVLPAGSYRVGYGVVDVDGVDRSSALLVDNIQIQQEIPFEFSPTLGLLIVGGMIAGDRFRRAGFANRLYRKLIKNIVD